MSIVRKGRPTQRLVKGLYGPLKVLATRLLFFEEERCIKRAEVSKQNLANLTRIAQIRGAELTLLRQTAELLVAVGASPERVRALIENEVDFFLALAQDVETINEIVASGVIKNIALNERTPPTRDE